MLYGRQRPGQRTVYVEPQTRSLCVSHRSWQSSKSESTPNDGAFLLTTRHGGLACDTPSHMFPSTICRSLQPDPEGLICAQRSWAEDPPVPAGRCRQVQSHALHVVKLWHELEVTGAEYDERTDKWTVRVRRTDPASGTCDEFDDVVDVLAIGVLSRWDWPEIEGLKNLKLQGRAPPPRRLPEGGDVAGGCRSLEGQEGRGHRRGKSLARLRTGVRSAKVPY